MYLFIGQPSYYKKLPIENRPENMDEKSINIERERLKIRLKDIKTSINGLRIRKSNSSKLFNLINEIH